MDIKYTEILSWLKKGENILNEYFDNYSSNEKSNEEENINNKLYEIQDKIYNINWLIKYYNKPIKDGYLILQENGRFKIFDKELTCGSCLEINYNNSWYFGRVEYDNGYYFSCNELENVKLSDIMYVRIRD